KGMRIAHDAESFPKLLQAAQNEAQAAFGDPGVYLERCIVRPRHVEFQVFGDTHGRVVHLGERDCSVQRRHQKLIEEAPSPALTPELRAAMGAAAVRAAEAVDYRGAGTVEFLYQEGEFFFLEMNTRLQVEHPVTELVTGLDLVQWQIRVAAGEALPFTQDDVSLTGHAVECRITAEDPFHGFLPSTGRIERLEVPAGPGVRWDGGIDEGFEVGLHYDPLLGKLIVHADTREAAVDRMARALDELVIRGVETCVPLHRRIMDHDAFRSGELSIRFLEEHAEVLEPGPAGGVDARAAAVAAALLEHAHRSGRAAPRIGGGGGRSRALPAWRASGWPWNRPA
ncbi:MAG: acetyl-CoA carboxylase biotin carboxylase subunit, partial [Longimicrobiales bacterium]